MEPRTKKQNRVVNRMVLLAAVACSVVFLGQRTEAQNRNLQFTSSPPAVHSATLTHSDASDAQSPARAGVTIPIGTILPVRLNSSLSSSKSKAGEPVSARLMQSVLLPSGEKIPQGSRVLGHIVEVKERSGSSLTTISLQFDKLVVHQQTIPITTNLRAIAGFMDVGEAQVPTTGAAEGDNYDELTTVQVGGDVVFGWGGPVTKGDDTSQVVGKAVTDGVVLRVSAKEGTKCRGAVNGNESLQSMWVFSSDACGVYGISHLAIAHAGRGNPVGTIVLTSDTNSLKIRGGAGMLLRIDTVND